MKTLLVLILLVASSACAMASDVYVHGYERANGTYVEGYHRSSPDAYKENNYGYRGY